MIFLFVFILFIFYVTIPLHLKLLMRRPQRLRPSFKHVDQSIQRTPLVPKVYRGMELKDPTQHRLKSIDDCAGSKQIGNANLLMNNEEFLPKPFICPENFVLDSTTAEAQRALEQKDLFFLWTTSWSSWQSRHHLFLQSVLVTRPNIFLVFLFFEESGDPHIFRVYSELGYCIRGIVIRSRDMLKPIWWNSVIQQEWLLKSKSLKYWKTHATDYFRFLILYKYGGVYSDTDSLFLQTLPLNQPFVGLDFNPTSFSWFADEANNLYAAPGVLSSRVGEVCLESLLNATFNFSSYNPNCFNCVGPVAFNMHCSCYGNIFDRLLLYPYAFTEIKSFFFDTSTIEDFDQLRKSSLAVHLFGHTSSDYVPSRLSMYASVFRTYSLLTEASSEHNLFSIGGQEKETLFFEKATDSQFINSNLLFIRYHSYYFTHFSVLNLTLQLSHGLLNGQSIKSMASQDISSLNYFISQIRVSLRSQIDSLSITLSDSDGKLFEKTLKLCLTV